MDKNRKIASAMALLVAGLGGIVVVRLALVEPRDLADENAVGHAGIPQRGHVLSPLRTPVDSKLANRSPMEGTSVTMDERHIAVYQNGHLYVLDRQTLLPISHRDLAAPAAPPAQADVQASLAPDPVALEQPFTE